MEIIALQNSDHLQLMFNVLVNVNTAKLELLFTNLAMNFNIMSSISAAIEMTPISKHTAQFAIESPTPRIHFKFFKYSASILFKSETEIQGNQIAQ